jgi:Ca2+-transporting ATPase
MADLTSSGKRILGLAKKLVSPEVSHLDTELLQDNLKWVGILVYADPVRPGVKDVLRRAQLAGIRIILITGDYPATAKFVMQEIGLPVEDRDILLGDEVRDLSLPRLAAKLKTIRLLARTSPDQKLKIVSALKSAGEVVAMMGDGVNDAPALHESDIGVVVAGASDVARESADLVLLDSDFKTVLSAIEEGRIIFDNIRKVILYLLSDAFEEIVVIIGSLLLHFPIPLTAIQILWINLFSDGFPNLALTVDPGRPSVMQEYPRSPREPLVNRWMVRMIIIISGLYGLMALLLFRHVYLTTGNEILVRSVAYVTLGINTLFYVFSVRNLWTPVWHGNIFNNKWLNVSLLFAFVMQFLPFTHPALLKIFGLRTVPLGYWLLAVVMSLVMAAIIEVFKTGYHRERRVILAESGSQTLRKI